ncbi:MAG: lipoyl synthase [Candidatus Latescibacterota bacterium]|nr:MAG: lipoyl synthase [Candidatus Latescibacterota bacterium]
MYSTGLRLFRLTRGWFAVSRRERLRRPDWLKVSLKTSQNFHEVNSLVSNHSLHTVCQEARCPNIYECWNQKTATFMILGDVCTRHCGFCSVRKGKPDPPDPDEPANTARAAEKMGLDYAVITSVDRDDLPDEGAGHFARTIDAIRSRLPDCKIEVLIPDFNGNQELLGIVLDARPEVLGHNVETVEALYRRVRPVASYSQSLAVLETSSRYRNEHAPELRTKTGIMVGLGETTDQLVATIKDIAATGCDILTIGQYLSPKRNALPVEKFYTPEEFDYLRDQALDNGIKHAESGPLVRSSYHAHNQFENSGS